MSFQTIGEETRLPIDEVEHLVMKALRCVCGVRKHRLSGLMVENNSLKLIRGSLDQVDQTAHISWVQPRVLSREQIGGLSSRLRGWVEKLGKVEERIAPEVLGSG